MRRAAPTMPTEARERKNGRGGYQDSQPRDKVGGTRHRHERKYKLTPEPRPHEWMGMGDGVASATRAKSTRKSGHASAHQKQEGSSQPELRNSRRSRSESNRPCNSGEKKEKTREMETEKVGKRSLRQPEPGVHSGCSEHNTANTHLGVTEN